MTSSFPSDNKKPPSSIKQQNGMYRKQVKTVAKEYFMDLVDKESSSVMSDKKYDFDDMIEHFSNILTISERRCSKLVIENKEMGLNLENIFTSGFQYISNEIKNKKKDSMDFFVYIVTKENGLNIKHKNVDVDEKKIIWKPVDVAIRTNGTTFRNFITNNVKPDVMVELAGNFPELDYLYYDSQEKTLYYIQLTTSDFARHNSNGSKLIEYNNMNEEEVPLKSNEDINDEYFKYERDEIKREIIDEINGGGGGMKKDEKNTRRFGFNRQWARKNVGDLLLMNFAYETEHDKTPPPTTTKLETDKRFIIKHEVYMFVTPGGTNTSKSYFQRNLDKDMVYYWLQDDFFLDFMNQLGKLDDISTLNQSTGRWVKSYQEKYLNKD